VENVEPQECENEPKQFEKLPINGSLDDDIAMIVTLSKQEPKKVDKPKKGNDKRNLLLVFSSVPFLFWVFSKRYCDI
jgi:hypothetical protein